MPRSPRRAATLALLLLGAAACERTKGPAAASTKVAAANLPVIRLDSAEAARRARALQDSVHVQLANGLAVKLFASDTMLADPIALDVDAAGTVYVTSNSRSDGLLDIRRHPDWVPIVHTLQTVDDLRAFYKRILAPENSAKNDWIIDRNKDGSRDIRDFAELKERIYRLRDLSGDGVADESRVMIEGFNEDPVNDVLGGLLLHGGNIYASQAPDLWRLRDTNGDGVIDEKESISHGYSVHPAFSGHGMAGITLGPDGRLYWSIGDIGQSVVDRDGKRWSYPRQGAIMRADPDGSHFEVFASGTRNSQALSFDEWGNLIGVDNDGDHPGETERVVYITNGSETGWRSNWQYGKYTDPDNNRYKVWMDEGMYKPRFAGQAAYFTPPIAAYHPGPTSLVYNPGTALGPAWRNTFLVSSFPGAPDNARIYAFKLRPEGAGFALASDTVFMQGILATGMRFGPQGALYFADWVDGWDSKGKGRIWTLDVTSNPDPLRAEVQKLLGESLEARPVAEVRTLMHHADMRIRQRAQFELVRRTDTASLRAVAGDTTSRLARVHAIWGLGQLARPEPRRAAMLRPFLGDADPEIRAQAAKMLGDANDKVAGDLLVPLLADSSPRVRFFAAEALGRIAHHAAIAPIVAMLAANDDRDVYLRQAGSTALARIGEVPPLVALSSHASRGVRLAAIIALRRMRDPGVGRFLDDRDELIVAEAARAITDDGGIEPALPALAAVLAQERFTSEPLLRRAIDANMRLGTREAADRVATFAARRGPAPALRVDALGALAVWPKPSNLDRVDGFYLGDFKLRDSSIARVAAGRLVDPILRGEAAPEVKVALAEALGRLRAKDAAPVLLAQLRSAAPPVRVAALQALQAMRADSLESAVRFALAERDSTVRSAALEMVPALALSDSASARLLANVVERGTLRERQNALAILGKSRGARANDVLGGLVDRLAAGTLSPEIALDVVEAVDSSGAAPLKAKVAAFQTARKASTMTAALGPALARGGDPRRGRQVIFQGQAAQCSRCHAFQPKGPTVGPNLSKVASRLSPDLLLESLLDPNAKIAAGFTAPSPMPPMGTLLKPREIRDVVAYLTTLR